MATIEALVVAVLLLIIGIAFGFYGYRWFMILLPVWAFLVGFIIGGAAVFGVYGQSILSPIIIIVAGLITGLLLAVLVYMFFNLAIILLGATLGYTFGFALGSGVALSMGLKAGSISILMGLAIAVLVGFLAFRLNLPKYIIIVLTALIGSEALLSGTLLLIGFIPLSDLKQGLLWPNPTHSATWSFIWLIIAAVGIAVQLYRVKCYELDLEYGKTCDNRD